MSGQEREAFEAEWRDKVLNQSCTHWSPMKELCFEFWQAARATQSGISASKTLEALGYTYCGGALWEPPLGLVPDRFKGAAQPVAGPVAWFWELPNGKLIGGPFWGVPGINARNAEAHDVAKIRLLYTTPKPAPVEPTAADPRRDREGNAMSITEILAAAQTAISALEKEIDRHGPGTQSRMRLNIALDRLRVIEAKCHCPAGDSSTMLGLRIVIDSTMPSDVAELRISGDSVGRAINLKATL